MWTHTQRQNTISQLAQKMSHLTAKPLAELHQLATDLENLAFSKAQGNQEQYVNILSKRMKKLEAQQSGLQTGSGVSLADSENEARMNKFWSIQETIRNGYLYQLQALHSDPYLRPPFLAEKCKDYVVRALRVSLLRRGDPQSMAHVGTEMLPKKLAGVQLMLDDLEVGVKTVKAMLAKAKDDAARAAGAQHAQSQTMHVGATPQQGLPTPQQLHRPGTPSTAANGREGFAGESGAAAAPGGANAGRSVSLLTELPQAPASATARSAPTVGSNAGAGSPIIDIAAFNAAAGAALSRSQTAPPNALLDPPYPTPVTPTILSTLASIASAEEVGNDPSSPASATTAHQLQKKRSADAREAQSTQSAPCLGGLGKRRASESNISVNMDAKRSRPRLAHVEAAIKQASETFKGVAKLEATDSLYSRDCIMLTCTLDAGSAPADTADTWRAVTLRISSAYPHEPPSVIVRMSQDAQLAPQGEAVRSVLETSLSTLPVPPSLEGILRCWISAVQSVEKAFQTSTQLTGAKSNPGLVSTPTARSTPLMLPTAGSNPMGSIASLVSAGLLPQSSGVMTQTLPQGSLGHLAALLDLPHGSSSTAAMMPSFTPQ
ncbi:hypothetical protein WJX79_002103 [Trebouxia sp. C0005]